ncbi:MAG TPA: hypothetical protein PKE12_01480 [Kiritimatiellia bacterium]|nr:hypothetical protein [Kiritimatiellia bacterium]
MNQAPRGRFSASVTILFSLCVQMARADQPPERFDAVDACPSISHVPILVVTRGVPAPVAAQIDCPTGGVIEVNVFVRPGDIGPITNITATGEDGGVYQATIPFSMIQGVDRFWYFIDATATNLAGQQVYLQSRWFPVQVIDSHAAMLLPLDRAGGGGQSTWLAAGVAIAGGALAFSSYDGGSSGPSASGPTAGVSPPGTSPPGGGGGGRSGRGRGAVLYHLWQQSGGESPGGEETCNGVTGGEQVSLGNAWTCEEGPIEIYVCGACPGASIRVTTSWGVDTTVPNVPFDACPTGPTPALTIPKNLEPGEPLSATITVYANGGVIAVIGWPLLDEDCNEQAG